MNVLESFSLFGKVALLTGGAGLYGRQILAALAEAGATVYTASRDLDALTQVAAEHQKQGHNVTALRLDQGDEASIRETVARIDGECGRIDVLVNNAVARTMSGGWEQGSGEDFDRSLHINGTGLFLLTREVGRILERQRSGSIVNIASMMGMVGVEPANYEGTDMARFSMPDYFFHKGGMINFTRYCASYFGRFGVRVNCVSPGGFQTPDQPAAFVRNYCARTQLGRMANDTDLKGIVVFLASDASAYVTGTNIPVDGGYTAK
jgi:NAD(P)-dependent dehydrogenase (short-subunit alcohol dehydrogenase family)